VSEDTLIDLCPICSQSPLTGDGQRYSCTSCGAVVQRKRRLGLGPRSRFTFRAVSPDYRAAEPDLVKRSFTLEELAAITGTCYTDAELSSIAAGDLSRIRPPTSTVASIIFGQSHEICRLQINGLTRAAGPPLSPGVDQVDGPVDRRRLQMLNRGNLFIGDQRLAFPGDTHTTIRVDRKLTGVRAYRDAFAVQRKGEETATYFLGCGSRQVALVVAYLQGRLDHLR